jgi:hypothetical protein
MNSPISASPDSTGLSLGAIRGGADDYANAQLPAAQTGAVSWGAILAGAAAAAALSLILLILGVGLGLSSVSPWTHDGLSAKTMGVSTIVWLALTQILASAMGGYLAGRLRTKWVAVHTDEVYFRDTAHGFLAWAVATLTTAALLSSVIGTLVGGGLQAGASVAGGVAHAVALTATSSATADGNGMGHSVAESGSMGYLMTMLFQTSHPAAAPVSAVTPASAPAVASASQAAIMAGSLAPAPAAPAMSQATLAQASLVMAHAMQVGSMSTQDQQYLAQVVAQHTGLTQPQAQQRVGEAFAQVQTQLKAAKTQTKELADQARKASAYAALWLFITLLIGAFSASLAATFGGQQRDL